MSVETSDQEKSVMLARLCGWEIWNYGDTDRVSRIVDNSGQTIFSEHSERSPVLNLYDPANMALAWRVVLFANNEYVDGQDWIDGFFTWWEDADLYKSEQPQRAWLDKILTLAIAAGMVTE